MSIIEHVYDYTLYLTRSGIQELSRIATYYIRGKFIPKIGTPLLRPLCYLCEPTYSRS